MRMCLLIRVCVRACVVFIAHVPSLCAILFGRLLCVISKPCVAPVLHNALTAHACSTEGHSLNSDCLQEVSFKCNIKGKLIFLSEQVT